MIFSHVLYQLSYLGLVFWVFFTKAPLFYTYVGLLSSTEQT